MADKKALRGLIREIRANGFDVELSGSGHWKVRKPEGDLVAVMPSTPGQGRAHKNTLAMLRREGVIG